MPGQGCRGALRAIVVGVIAAGLGGPAVASAATPGVGDPGERAEALLRGDAINRFVAKQLPATFAVRGDRDAGIGAEDVTLVDARYCGAKDASRGRVVGVLRPAGSGAAPLAAIEARDCQGKLDEIARRLAGPPDAGAVAVVELVAEWVPWQLRVSIGDVAASGEGGRALARTLARARAAGPLAAIDTSALRLETERGSSLSFDLALAFLKAGDGRAGDGRAGDGKPGDAKAGDGKAGDGRAGDGKAGDAKAGDAKASDAKASDAKASDGVLATLTLACQGCAPAPRGPLVVNPAAAPADVDGVVGATLRFANRVIALYSEDGPLVLEMERQTVEVRGLQISGGAGTLVVRGRATARGVSESAEIRIESAGADLRLGEVRAVVENEDCSALSGGAFVRCGVRNAARGPAAGALAAAMTSRYRGRPLRALIAPPPFSFEVGGRRITLRLTPTRASASASSLIVFGKADFD
jgi:hypothetical protein